LNRLVARPMLGKSASLLFSTLATVAVLVVQPLLAASDPDWPFALLPKPSEQTIHSFPSEQTPAPKTTAAELPAGEYVAPKDLTIKLNGTENKPFKLSGEVWLDGSSPRLRYPTDEPSGFGLFLREIDGLHRYQVNDSLLLVKRRLLEGMPLDKIVHVSAFPNFPLRTWTPFSLEATGDRITFSFGGYQREIRGPLNVDGTNEIALVAGTKLRSMRLEILHDAPDAVAWGRNP